MNAEEIAINYGFSIIVMRWAATLIDYFILLVISTISIIILGEGYYETLVFFWLLFIVIYYVVLEGVSGYTLGKLLFRIKVINNDFTVPGIHKSSCRTLLRLIEVNPVLFGGLPAAIIINHTKYRQRLGDVIAQTYVVKVKDIKNSKVLINN
ncbi:UNVERIFIED_CONTAM: putative RDD family membrane protein YckC [Acetivibrio alkalicellulosi]